MQVIMIIGCDGITGAGHICILLPVVGLTASIALFICSGFG